MYIFIYMHICTYIYNICIHVLVNLKCDFHRLSVSSSSASVLVAEVVPDGTASLVCRPPLLSAQIRQSQIGQSQS